MIPLRFARSVISRRNIFRIQNNYCISAYVANMSEDFGVVHDGAKRQFTITLEGISEPAIIEYKKLQDGSVDLHHTEVPVAFRGKGIAKVLAKGALDHFSTSQTKMHLTCTYLQKYVKDNPDPAYLAHVVE